MSFSFTPSEDETDRMNGWGSGILYIFGIPYWYANSADDPQLIKWTWVDLLEHIASNWGALVFEQSYPYPWLSDVAHPGDVWGAAERRWTSRGEALAEIEESTLLAFERRHNLAYAWKGLSLPSLTLMRNGRVYWMCPDGQSPIRASFRECHAALVSIGDTLARSFEGSDNPRVMSAINRWHNREKYAKDGFFKLITGMSEEKLSAVQGGTEPFSFWEMAANDPSMDGLLEEGPLLAAARMTAGICDSATIQRILRAIRKVPLGNLDELDRISSKARQHLQKKPAQVAFLGGYAAAEFVRETLKMDRPARFEIEAIFDKLSISVAHENLHTSTIDAIAVWGVHGPCVILNKDRKHTTSERTRMTLAHELGHLILDRTGGLPFCEVLGGAIDNFMERRANAFAAELLLPRSIVEYMRETGNRNCRIGDFISLLKQDFGVSKTVVCAQIFNSRVFDSLNIEEQNFVEYRLRRDDPFGFQETNKVQPTTNIV